MSDEPILRLLEPSGALSPEAAGRGSAATDLDLPAAYRDMVLARRVDTEAVALQRQGELGLWPSMLGQEAAQIGAAHALSADDMVFPTYREHGVARCRGVDPVDLLGLFRGTTLGGWRPQDRNFGLHMVGPMRAERPEAGGVGREGPATRRWLAEHDSVVYASLGAHPPLTAEHVSALFAAFARLRPPHHALWRLTRPQRELLPPRHAWPDHLRIEDADPEDAADAEVLAHPHVRAFVTHGAHDRFHEAVYFGKPLLVLPLHADSAEFGARAVASGVGLAVADAPGFGVHDVLPGLLRLLGDRRFDEEARRWSGRLRQAGGVRRAAGLLLDELGRSAHADARS